MTANKERGEAVLHDGAVEYVLRPEFNAMCELEAQMDTTSDELMRLSKRGAVRAVRGLLWAYLQPKHAGLFPTLKEAGDLIQRVGIDEALRALSAATRANASEKPNGKAGKGANPPKAQSEPTGVDSFEMPVGSV